jgi:septin 7
MYILIIIDDLHSTHMEELKEYTNDVLYENYRTEKLSAMGIQQDPTVFKEVNPIQKMEEERTAHEQKLSKMEAEMKAVFQAKVQEKETKLKMSEEEVRSTKDDGHVCLNVTLLLL